MNNITYNITENNITENNIANENDNLNKNNDNIKTNIETNIETNININEKIARELDYELNYNFKNLTLLLEIYGMKKQKLNKSQIIEKIVDFEIDINNIYIVEKNKRLYNNLLELKNNSSFSKYILI